MNQYYTVLLAVRFDPDCFILECSRIFHQTIRVCVTAEQSCFIDKSHRLISIVVGVE